MRLPWPGPRLETVTARLATPSGEGSRIGPLAWLDGLLVFALAYVYLELLPDCFGLFDESLVAATAERLYAGEILYRDVFSYWNPGVFWLHAGLFSVAGVSVEAVRLPLTLFGAAAAVGVWRLARDHSGRAPAILAGLALPLVCYPVWWKASPHWYSTFAVIAAALTLRHCFGGRYTPFAVLATGALCGIAFIFLQPVGVLIFGATGAVLAWDAAWMRSRGVAFKRIALLAGGALVPTAVMYGYFAVNHALGEMVYDTILWPLEGFRRTMHTSYGAEFWMPSDLPFRITRVVLMAVPPVAIGVSLFLTGSKYPRRAVVQRERREFASASIAAGLLASNYYYPDVVHLAFAAPLACAVVAALTVRLGRRDRGRGLALVGAVLTCFFVVLAGLGSFHRKQSTCSAELSTARGTITVQIAMANALRDVFSFLAEHLAPGERLYVYPYGPGFSFLSGHPNPTPFEGVLPGQPLFTTAVQLEQVVSALEEQPVRYIVLTHLNGRGILQQHNTALERYIRRRYHVAKDFGSVLVLERDSPGERGPKIFYRGRPGRKPRR